VFLPSLVFDVAGAAVMLAIISLNFWQARRSPATA
jgi:hypothetical protein